MNWQFVAMNQFLCVSFVFWYRIRWYFNVTWIDEWIYGFKYSFNA